MKVYKFRMPNETYIGEDGFLKCVCEVCNKEMNFSSCYCAAKEENLAAHGHKKCVMAYKNNDLGGNLCD